MEGQMAINEACQVWIEQRIQEELADKPESGKSLRAIGRELAQEIERIFEAKVHPNTLRQRATRMFGGTNVPLDETLTAPTVDAGDTGDKLTPTEVINMMSGLVKSGKSSRDAADIVAGKCGKKPATVRQAYARHKIDEYTGDASSAMQFAQMAILQLRRIQRNDKGRVNALRHVTQWIASQEGYTDG
jgi:hypothetical protein